MIRTDISREENKQDIKLHPRTTTPPLHPSPPLPTPTPQPPPLLFPPFSNFPFPCLPHAHTQNQTTTSACNQTEQLEKQSPTQSLPPPPPPPPTTLPLKKHSLTLFPTQKRRKKTPVGLALLLEPNSPSHRPPPLNRPPPLSSTRTPIFLRLHLMSVARVPPQPKGGGKQGPGAGRLLRGAREHQ